jgi:PAS domain S-box-containing protein
MNRLNLDDLVQQIQNLYQLTGKIPIERSHLDIVSSLIDELSTRLEELQVANARLCQQEQELIATRQVTELQRQHHQELSELIPDAYIITNVNGVIQETNHAAVTLLNRSPQFLVGVSLHVYVAEGECQAFYNQLNQLHQTNGVQEWEINLQSPNITPKTVMARVALIRNQNGCPMGLRWLLRDLTPGQQAEPSLRSEELDYQVKGRTALLERFSQQVFTQISEGSTVETALHQQEQQFRALVEHAPDIIERFDREGRHLYVNPAIERITGKPPTEFIGKTSRELGVSEPNLSLWEQALSRVFETQEDEQFEFSIVTREGLKYYQTRLVPELDVNGKAVSVLGISRDITERKLADEAMRESEQRFRQIAENIDEVFWIIDVEKFQMLYASPAYQNIWERSPESLYEVPMSWLDAIHPEDRDRILAASVEKELKGEYDEEYRIVRSDGSIRWIRDRAFPILNSQGNIYRLAGLAEDITPRKQAELEVYKALQTERELNELKSSFVAMTSHEFRSPLTTIHGSVELLERYRHRLSDEKQATHLQRIKMAVERMIQLLDDILIFHEAEAGKLKFHPKPLNVVQFCRNLIEDLQFNAKNQQTIHFTHGGDCYLPILDINSVEITESNGAFALPLLDEKLLRHILSNLLLNALKYSPNSSPVQFDFTLKDKQVIFQIQDQGIGIPIADQTRLFESFHRASNVGSIKGTGLGLTIVKQCVDLHQGEITFTSEVGKGTTFKVVLPLTNH